MNRESNITGMLREDMRWYELTLEKMHNGIKCMFGFDVAEDGTDKGIRI